MANLTISVNDETLRQARIRALQESSSVNALLNDYLEEYARSDELRRRREQALRSLLALADRSGAGRGGNAWTREELHED